MVRCFFNFSSSQPRNLSFVYTSTQIVPLCRVCANSISEHKIKSSNREGIHHTCAEVFDAWAAQRYQWAERVLFLSAEPDYFYCEENPKKSRLPKERATFASAAHGLWYYPTWDFASRDTFSKAVLLPPHVNTDRSLLNGLIPKVRWALSMAPTIDRRKQETHSFVTSMPSCDVFRKCPV